MDPILDLPADLPPHDPAPPHYVPARTICEWPVGTFVENLVPLTDGSFAVSVLSEARIDRVWPDGRRATLVQLTLPVTGLVRIGSTLFAAVGVPEKAPWSIWTIDLASGAATQLLEVAGAVFLNGMAALSKSVLLANESVHGRVLRVDLGARASTIWLEDERLLPAPKAPFLPGANGLKLHDGYAWITSNGRALFCRAPIVGDRAGILEVVAERLRGDDFAFDTAGNAYIATHIGHSLDRLAQNGTRVTLAGADHGLAGSTACAFGITPADAGALYVTTTGGIIGPVGGALQPARLVRLALGATGAPLFPEEPA